MNPSFQIPRIVAFLGASLVAAAFVGATRPQDGYVVHEWGTFTDVQGADGVQMDWSPLIAPDLPAFVYDRYHDARKARVPGYSIGGKSVTVTRQRMETPVIYFYSD